MKLKINLSPLANVLARFPYRVVSTRQLHRTERYIRHLQSVADTYRDCWDIEREANRRANEYAADAIRAKCDITAQNVRLERDLRHQVAANERQVLDIISHVSNN